MKTVLVIAAVLGISSSAAFADCAGHSVSASVPVDRQAVTASITPPSVKLSGEQAMLQKPSQAEAQKVERPAAGSPAEIAR